MIVEVKRIPIRHNGERYTKGSRFEIDRKHYEKIKDHVNVIDEDDSPKPIEKKKSSKE